jgi:hydroxyethylthiazole kinase-like uncharacterized protein yjeF
MNRAPHTKENSPALWQIPPLLRDHHKYDRGHVALLGGATMTGAAKLAALAAQRAGAGLVTLAADRAVWPIYAMGMMSVITLPLDGPKDWATLLAARKVSAVLLGPGCAPGELKRAMPTALKTSLPLVLDAGALAWLAQHPVSPVRNETMRLVLTPHAGEYARLAQAYGIADAPSPQARAQQLARASGAIVVLKGADTAIAAPQGPVVRNRADAPWLATAGTGDVLAGLIAGLLAQGMAPFDAACAGVWLHSEAARTFGPGMVAEDLLGAVPTVLRALLPA